MKIIGTPRMEPSLKSPRRCIISLVHMTEDESYDLIASNHEVKGNGFESRRRFSKRWDPIVAGMSQKLLRLITNPKQSTMRNCLRSIQAWKLLVTRCDHRRDAKGERRSLAEDIKWSSFEVLVPK